MPKIFLIKNRLLQQQQKLLENQKSREELSPPGSPLAEPQPLSLIVNRNQDAQNSKKEEESFELRSGSPDICGTSSPASPGLQSDPVSSASTPPRRFISSILGGDVPYGSSRGHHVLTSAEKKEYLPTDRPEDPKPHPKCQQVSVIQRTPSLPSKPDKPDALMVIEEPEQEAPIDYHVPKKDPEKELEEIKRNRIALAIKRGQILIAGRKLSSAGQILMAAAGPSRSSGGGGGGGGGSGGGQQGSGGGGSRGGGGSSGGSSYTLGGGGGGGLSSGNSGGSLGGGGPGGAGGGGGPGKPNYGPSSPPTGSLPPFYESLKGGGLHGYTTQQYGTQYQSLMAESLAMDCDTGQDLHNSYPPNTGGGDGPPKQYSLLQNVCATYGICVKEEDDLASYVKDQSFLPYDDTLMVDPMSGAVVDPLQFTATLTFSSPADHTALIESLSDAADLILRETTENMPPPVEPSVNPFPEHRLGMQQPQEGPVVPGNQQQATFANAAGRLPPGYCDSIKQERGDLVMTDQERHSQQLQLQQPKQNKWENSSGSLLSPGLSSLELDSSTSMSLPSPTSCSLDGTGSLSPPPPPPPPPADLANIPSLQVRVGVLQHRLGLPGDTALEFVNGGHGIKNPLANQDTTPVPRHPAEVDKADVDSKPASLGANGKFTCHLCSKTFSLQRLLNRHMKCHSDVKRYLCTFCGKGFNDTFDLKRHTRTHTGVRPYKCNLCEKSFTQRCSLESHCLKVHGVQHQYAYKERRTKMYVCEDCGHTTNEPEVHYLHLKDNHPYSPALLKFYDKRHFKFTNSNFANMLLCRS